MNPFRRFLRWVFDLIWAHSWKNRLMARYAIVQVMVEVADDESVDDVRGVDTKHTYYDKVIQYTVNYFKTKDIVVVEW